LRRVERIEAAMGRAGWVAEGKSGASSAVDIAATYFVQRGRRCKSG
jgi:hypothetical protein